MNLKPDELNEIREHWESHAYDVQLLVDEIFRLRAVLERIGTVCSPDNRLIGQIARKALEK